MNPRGTLRLVRLYLFLVLLLLPVDYFLPTAFLFREGGAKPAIPLLVIGSLYLLCSRWKIFFSKLDLPSFRTGQVFFGVSVAGVLALVINLFCGWSYFGGGKDPLEQALSQAALFVLLPVIAITHGDLLSSAEHVAALVQLLPCVVAIHLLCIGLEAAGVLQSNILPLSLFRTPDVSFGKQPSGLMTEPSYVGVMAASYGLALLQMGTKETRVRRVLLGLTALGAAFAIGGKTVVPALVAGVLAFLWQVRAKVFSRKSAAVFVTVLVASAYLVNTSSALDVDVNLSTAMRLGSTVLAWRAANAGYGLTGVGFGQFHFFYRPEFAPVFLTYSGEAAEQFSRSVMNRASTYNLFVRFLIETGVMGLTAFLGLLAYLLRLARKSMSPGAQFGTILFGSSLGFLLTQDPYCYPPLALGMALILGSAKMGPPLDGDRTV